MATKIIMVIRHAEKPDDAGKQGGVDENGKSDPESLTPRGWSRAGAIAAFLAPVLPMSNEALTQPTAIYASAPAKHGEADGNRIGTHSRRPLQTISPLASKLGIKPILTFTRGEEAKMVADAKAIGGVVLICWDHQDIPVIAGEICGQRSPATPLKWPGDRFDVVWVFERTDSSNAWTFEQVCQRLLPNDSDLPMHAKV